MKIVLFGATGKTGLPLLTRLLADGHQVTVLVRSPAKVTVQHPHLSIEQGDVFAAEEVTRVIRGQEVVITTLGSRKLGPDPICATTAKTITDAMAQTGVKRLVTVSGAALGQHPGLLMTLLVKLLLKHILADASEADALIQKTELDWTIVRPSRINEAAAVQKYDISPVPFRSPLLIRLSARPDVVDFVARVTREASYTRQVAYLSTRSI